MPLKNNEGVILCVQTPSEADAFASDMRGTLSPQTANLAINAPLAFCAMLAKWQVITSIPFIKVRRAKRAGGQTHRIQGTANIDGAIERANSQAVKEAIKVLSATELRVGGLPTLKTDQKARTFIACSKGKSIKPRAIPTEVAIIYLTQWQSVRANGHSRVHTVSVIYGMHTLSIYIGQSVMMCMR